MADEILIRVRSTHDDPYEYSDVTLSQETVTLEQLIQENESIFRGLGYIKINDAGKVDKKDIEILRRSGWIHEKTVEDREKKKILKQDYFLVDENPKFVFYPQVRKVNIEELTEQQLDQLSTTAKIVQEVDEKSVLSEAQNKRLETKKRQEQERKNKKKLSAQKKAEKKKEKELEAARKLLLEAGQI
ncbi:MAG: hypothetical protein EKK64_00780 [Neisseriaceae bacterium]|nr:MAG: hypothetical protein EKK64_00780 [Neisseriaceae bacterium]